MYLDELKALKNKLKEYKGDDLIKIRLYLVDSARLLLATMVDDDGDVPLPHYEISAFCDELASITIAYKLDDLEIVKLLVELVECIDRGVYE